MDVYEIVNEKIIGMLEKGTVPWRCPWDRAEAGIPRNFASTKPYRGINTFLLYLSGNLKGYRSPFWLTYKQAFELGGHVKQGEKSEIVVFFKPWEIENKETGDKETIPLLRYYRVFNTEQCEGLRVPDLGDGPKYEHEKIGRAETIVEDMPNRPTLHVDQQSNRAFYRPSTDVVTVPTLSQFKKAEEYYSTLFHELGHSTGHQSRLNREFGQSFADHTYGKEELVAEFTASYLCATCGIAERTLENSASYIDHWATILRDKTAKKWIVWACNQAQRAADYIQGKTRTEEPAVVDLAA